MNIGKKIKEERLRKSMTQAALCEEKITRNMLSAIENGRATPSLETLLLIAARLELPASYFLSEDESIFNLRKNQEIQNIKKAYRDGHYPDCISLINRLDDTDDELSLMLAFSHFEVGKKALFAGSLISAKKHLDLAEKHCKSTIYDTTRISNVLPIYQAVAKNIQSPLLELDIKSFETNEQFTSDYEFYKYITLDLGFDYKNEIFKRHISAKALIRERDYTAALSILKKLEEEKTPRSYNAYAFFSIYADMETCYKQISDFENAYRYSSKRLSMLEGFKA